MRELKDYFEYQYTLAREVVVPLLAAAEIDFTGKTILDAGCGQGGLLHFLAAHCRIASALGIDLDPQAIARAERNAGPKLQFEVRDFLSLPEDQAFDVVILRDVLEHIVDVERAFDKACALLRKGGCLYLSYAPFYSPFGGHQHNGTGFFSRVPWLQLLPEQLFLKLIRLRGNAYKTGGELARDVRSVLATRVTARKMAALLSASRMEVLFRSRYLVRPDYQLKFGIRPVPLPATYLPVLTELLGTAEELLLRKP